MVKKNNIFKLYGLDKSNYFSDDELKKYTKTLVHREKCTQENKNNRIVGKLHIIDDEDDYLLYSCKECGCIYAKEGDAPALYYGKGS